LPGEMNVMTPGFVGVMTKPVQIRCESPLASRVNHDQAEIILVATIIATKEALEFGLASVQAPRNVTHDVRTPIESGHFLPLSCRDRRKKQLVFLYS
jgi:hypothetical protein